MEAIVRRMQDDEIAVLRFFAGQATFYSGLSRSKTIVKKLQYHGLVDASEELTKRGRHVVSKLPPLPEALPEPERKPEEIPEPQPELKIELIEETDWD